MMQNQNQLFKQQTSMNFYFGTTRTINNSNWIVF